MTSYYVEPTGKVLVHAGVKGMKWGVRKARRQENRVAARAARDQVKTQHVMSKHGVSEAVARKARAQSRSAGKKAVKRFLIGQGASLGVGLLTKNPMLMIGAGIVGTGWAGAGLYKDTKERKQTLQG